MLSTLRQFFMLVGFSIVGFIIMLLAMFGTIIYLMVEVVARSN